MNSFDQTRANRDAISYNTDGRNYDLKLQDDQIQIVARSAAFVLWIWTLMTGILVGSFSVLLIPVSAILTWQRYFLAVVACFVVHQMTRRIIGGKNGNLEPKRWILDKNTMQFCADAREIARLEEIIAVRGWKKGRRFLLSLQLRDGREFRLGLLKFATKEWAWRQDAAQIAEFLGVPLDIPPV